MTTAVSDHVHAARVAHGAWVVAMAVGLLAQAASGRPAAGAAAFALGALPALAVLAAGRAALTARGGVVLLALWSASVAASALALGAAWPVLASWFLAPAAAAALLRPNAPLWEGAAFAAVALAATAFVAPAGRAEPPVVAANLAPLLFVSVTLWAVRARYLQALDQGRLSAAATRRLVDGASGALLRVAGGDVVVEAAGACTRLLGIEPQQLAGQRAADLVDPSSAPALTDALARARRNGAAGAARVSVLGQALRARVTPLGRGEAAIEIMRLSPMDAQLAALERRHAEAVAAVDQKTQFYARLSHELRTPLNAVLGFSDIMRAKVFGPLPVKYAEYADLIHESATHLLSLVDSVVDLSKIESGAYPLEAEVFDAREALDAALRMTTVLAEAGEVVLVRQAPEAPVLAEADPRALRQILINLLANAIKFTPPGGRVEARVGERDGALVLEVTDTGPGLSPEEIARLGQPYLQTRTGRESHAPGAGLGLAIVRALAQMHGGVFEAESVLGEGATMRVRAPVLCGAAPDASRASG